MSPLNKRMNGQSPLVNPQRRITSFFGKKLGPSPSPSPAPSSGLIKQNPSSGGSPSLTTPSPLQQKRNKPLLVVGSKLVSSSSSSAENRSSFKEYGEEIVDKRIKVYWPLDKSWYVGSVKSFDKVTGKHLVQYDDNEEEMLNLAEEKFELIEERVEKFRRIRKFSLMEDEEEGKDLKELEDDLADEDWVETAENEDMEDEDFFKDIDLLVEEEMSKRNVGQHKNSMPQVLSETERTTSVPNKKRKIVQEKTNSLPRISLDAVKQTETPERKNDNGKAFLLVSPIVGDAAERFVAHGQKLRFLDVDRKDASGRRPGDENYDPRTLHLPLDFLKSLSGGQRQWWEFKSKHMDKVLFYKVGKFYRLYEMDAHVGAKELGLEYMKGVQPHCRFHEKNFSMNVGKLAREGYRVLVIEQTETPEQLELRRQEKGSKDKVVKREICSVFTKGTLTDEEFLSDNPDASYLMAVTENCRVSENQQGRHVLGVCVIDAATSTIILGQFTDDSDCSSLCCLLSELRPVEIIKPAKLLCPETENALFRHTRNPLVNELIPLSEFWDAGKTLSEVGNIYRCVGNNSYSSAVNETVLQSSESTSTHKNTDCLPNALSRLVNLGDDGSQALSALGGAIFYLRQVFLDETLLRFANFELLPGFGEVAQKPYMIVDAAALENLEIFENSRDGDTSGTLFAQLDRCATGFGKRLLKKWIARPLYHLESIKDRQDAIAELKMVNQHVLEFRKKVSKLPDMERLLARVFAGWEAIGRNSYKVMLFEDAAKKQLQKFVSALRGCELMTHACSALTYISEKMESSLLRHLLMPGAMMPDVGSILAHFKDAFDWEEANQSGRIIPHEGADLEYDAACQKLKDIESKLGKHLKEQRKLLGDSSICYATVGKDTYLLEVPESLSHKIPQEYELRSSKKGFFRYWNPIIRLHIGEVSRAESDKESKLKTVLQRLIGQFAEEHCKWRQMVSIVAELDVLTSLSIASGDYEGRTCRPVLSAPCNGAQHLSARNLGHPILRSDSFRKGTFVTNDVRLGGQDHASFILLTGPNMGGKSTLLRQICWAVILAQIGAEVPAEIFTLSPIDRIFVRMGAKDHIMAGESTFLTELLETASMLKTATHRSLVALDELGRGTSTVDGQAIAAAVLEHLVRTVQCLGMFSTHYHRLAVDYQKDSKVSLRHMACQVVKGTGGLEEVTFLYKLTPGACPKSYGINVARLAGLPDTILYKAAAKSRELEVNYDRKLIANVSAAQRWEDEETSLIIKEFIKIASTSECGTATDSTLLCTLAKLQSRARSLLSLN